MGIWLLVIIWMLLAGVFVLAICSAAARPIPKPTNGDLAERQSVNRDIATRSSRALTACQAVGLAVLLAVITTSCATSGGSYRTGAGSSEPVKGATLLMQH